MATETNSNPPVPTTGIIADRDLYLSDDRATVVEKGDEKAAFLLAARGSMIDPRTVQMRRLSVKNGKVVVGKAEDAEEGLPLDLGRPNEGQIRAPGEPLILTPRTGVMRPEPAPREIHKPGDEVEVGPGRQVVVSNVPPEDDELRAKVAEETKGEDAADEPVKKSGARKRGKKGS